MSSMIETKIAKILLETRAIKLSPDQQFKWSSGWNSPIYCDNRTVLSFAKYRKEIKEMLSEKIKQHYPLVVMLDSFKRYFLVNDSKNQLPFARA